MEMHQVRYALAVAELGSFTRAAERCRVSQPSLTSAVRKLEAELGAPLFHRESKGALPSAFGQLMIPQLRRILEQTEAAAALAQSFHLLDQVPVRLGVLPTIGPVRLSRLLARYRDDHPGIELAVHEGALELLLGRLHASELDLAVLSSPDDTGLRLEPLYRERYVVVFPAGHRFERHNAIRLADVSGEAYVDRLACEMREMVMQVCGTRGIELYAGFRSEREDWIQGMVLARLGFAFMPEYSVTLPGVLSRPLIEPEIERTVALATLPGRPHTPAVAAFIRAARAQRWPG